MLQRPTPPYSEIKDAACERKGLVMSMHILNREAVSGRIVKALFTTLKDLDAFCYTAEKKNARPTRLSEKQVL